MSRIHGFVCGVVVAAATAYTGLAQLHTTSLRVSSGLRQIELLVDDLVTPPERALEQPKYTVRRAGMAETMKDLWNRELEASVRWLQDTQSMRRWMRDTTSRAWKEIRDLSTDGS